MFSSYILMFATNTLKSYSNITSEYCADSIGLILANIYIPIYDEGYSLALAQLRDRVELV